MMDACGNQSGEKLSHLNYDIDCLLSMKPSVAASSGGILFYQPRTQKKKMVNQTHS